MYAAPFELNNPYEITNSMEHFKSIRSIEEDSMMCKFFSCYFDL